MTYIQLFNVLLLIKTMILLPYLLHGAESFLRG